jgi:hypothetical protein
MPKKKPTGLQTQTIQVRNFPSDLVEQLRELKRVYGINLYQFIRQAVREKYDREYGPRENY